MGHSLREFLSLGYTCRLSFLGGELSQECSRRYEGAQAQKTEGLTQNPIALAVHHIPPCTRPTETEPRYVYCPQATTDATTKEQQACGSQTYDDSQGWFDFDNPCSSSPCLLSTKCSAGGCRLEQLSGRWKCCRCQRGGNGYTHCQQPMRSSPDTFCYHVCCADCGADPVARTR